MSLHSAHIALMFTETYSRTICGIPSGTRKLIHAYATGATREINQTVSHTVRWKLAEAMGLPMLLL